ncbi:protein angel homolog 2 [Centroberyx affinis]|uniref:protein angel homolog 2 n=1 Tax=Centroberyx affinis TaxID=166261 RepID=UPI003A5BA714
MVIVPLGNFAGSCRSFHVSAGLMERPDRDRGPPHKRRKSAEEKRSVEEREWHREGAGEKVKEGGPRKEHHRLDPSAAGSPRWNHWFKDRSRDRGKNRDGEKGGSRENSSRDKGGERSRTGNRDGDRSRHAELKGGTAPDRGRSHEQGGRKESQPAGGSQTRTQSSGSKPSGQDSVSLHSPKPNPWFKDRGKEEQGGHGRDGGGTGGEPGDRSKEGGGGREPPPPQPPNPPNPTNPWLAAGARRPAPQDRVTPSRRLQRHWEVSPGCSTGLQPPGCDAAFDFSVMSYNILSQDLLRDNVYLYRHCHPAVLPWEHRLPNLLAEIQHYNADILSLQEVQEDHYETQMKPALQALGYQCEYKKRTGRKPDGCAVIFKTSRLSLVSSNPVEFFRPGDALLDRDNVGLVLLLRPNDAVGQSDPSACICVANTHLLYNPRRGDIKLAQLAILLAEIRRLSRLPDGSTNPVVVCGDFNSTPWSPLYSFLTTGCLQYQGLPISKVSGQENSPRGQRLLTAPIWSSSLGINQRCQYENDTDTSTTSPTGVEGAISNLTVGDLTAKAVAAFNSARIEHSVKLQSSYQHLLMHDGRPEITTCHSRTAMTVDYILYTPDSNSSSSSLPGGRGLQLLGKLSLVGQSELEEVNSLPNQHHSSDHLPLLARFRLRR